jgi:hypothetical protein
MDEGDARRSWGQVAAPGDRDDGLVAPPSKPSASLAPGVFVQRTLFELFEDNAVPT